MKKNKIIWNSNSQEPALREPILILMDREIFCGYYDDCVCSFGHTFGLRGEHREFFRNEFLGCIDLKRIQGWIELEDLVPDEEKCNS